MRKNYFAKKFVAYSMAFAVAFSTLTVSPVFVKEAKAAADLVGNASADASLDYSGTALTGVDIVGQASPAVVPAEALLDSVVSSTGTSTVDLDEVTKAAGFSNGTLKVAKMETKANSDTNTYGARVSFDDLVFTSDFSGASTAASGKTIQKKAGENVELTGQDAGNKWYKLDKVTDSFTRGANATETVTYVAYKLTEKKVGVNPSTGNLSIESLSNNQFGYYISVKSDGTAVQAWNVLQVSDLNAYSERSDGNYYAKKGDTAVLTVKATSNISNITYTWKKGTEKLAETSNVLKVENVDNTKVDSYTCVVSDGVSTKSVEMVLNIAKYDDSNRPIAYQSFVKHNKATDALGVPLPHANELPGGVVTLKSCVPTQEDYRYVWIANGVKVNGAAGGNTTPTLSEADTLNYDAKSNSITITDKDNTYDGATVTCYVLYKDTYEALTRTSITIAEQLKKLKDAAGDVSVNNIKKDILATELVNAGSLNALYTETFTFIPEDNKINSAEYINKTVGESVTVALPDVAQFAVDGLNKTDVAFTAGSGKLDKDFTMSQLIAEDFGAKEIEVKTYTYTAIANDGSASYSNTASYYKLVNGKYTELSAADVALLGSNPKAVSSSKFIANYDSASNLGYKLYTRSANANSTAKLNKFVNIVYQPELAVTADNLSAKVGDKAELKVTATTKLQPQYTWKKWTSADGKAAATGTTVTPDATDNSKLTISALKESDIYVAEELYADKSVKTAESNYYTCTVDNGIELKTVKITISSDGGFKYKDLETQTTYTTAEEITFNKFALADKNITLAPIVKENNGAKLSYTWYKNAVSTTPVSTEASYTTTFDGKADVRYVLVIKDETSSQVATINYIVNTLKTEDITDIKVLDIPAQTYTGSAITPAFDINVTTTGGTNVLASKDLAGTDFTVEYKENVNVGIARVTVKVGNKEDNGEFFIDRADNELKVADKVVAVGGSVQPKTTNKAGAAVTYTYYTDEACTKVIEGVPSKVGVYYVKATSIATTNYNEATSNVAKVVIAPGKPKIGNTSRTASSVTLNWAKTSGATAYRVYVKKNGKFTKVANTTGLKYTVTGLASATTYEFAVKAFVKGVASPVYSVRKTTTAPAKVATPAVKAGSKKATVTFKKVTRATGYQVYMAKGNGKYVKVATTKNLSVTKTGLTKGATYKFKVRAYKTVGSNTYYGAFSSAKAVKVK